MRWAVLMAAVLCAGGAQALAAKCGNSGNPDVLKLVSWKGERAPARPNAAPAVDVTVEVENAGTKPIRMVDGAVWFTDALGGNVGGMTLPRDMKLAPGAKLVERARYSGAFERLPDLRPNEVQAIACVRSVLYEDGEKATFR